MRRCLLPLPPSALGEGSGGDSREARQISGGVDAVGVFKRIQGGWLKSDSSANPNKGKGLRLHEIIDSALADGQLFGDFTFR